MTLSHMRRNARRFFPAGEPNAAARREAFVRGCKLGVSGAITNRAIVDAAHEAYPGDVGTTYRIALYEGVGWAGRQTRRAA